MKLKYLLFIFFLALSFNIKAQNADSQKIPINDSAFINAQIPVDNSSNQSFEDRINLDTKLQTQKLLKNLFLAGFIFMSLVVFIMIYINNTKIKQILEMIKLQEKQIDLKNFETEKMSIILNNTLDAIAIIDINNNILWSNNSFLNVFGYTSDEIVNKPINFFSSDDSNVIELINKAKNDKKPVQFSFAAKNKTGDDIFVQRRIIPIVDKKSEIENYAIIDTDFTALKIALGK